MAFAQLKPRGISEAPVCQNAGSSDAATQNENCEAEDERDELGRQGEEGRREQRREDAPRFRIPKCAAQGRSSGQGRRSCRCPRARCKNGTMQRGQCRTP